MRCEFSYPPPASSLLRHSRRASQQICVSPARTCEIAPLCHNQPHGTRHPATFQRIRRTFRHRRHLVGPVTLSVLPNRFYDPWSQNFYRYAVACLAIIPFVLCQLRRGRPKIDLQAVALCIIPCLPNVVHQITQVVALFYMGPGAYGVFARSSVIFTALLALAFFPEERYVIRQWQFQLGTVLGLVGAFGVIWFQSNGQD